MNALTFALIGFVFSFTVPKIYQVYQVPIDRTAQQVLDQINQLLAKWVIRFAFPIEFESIYFFFRVTSKLPNKAKTA